MSVYPLQLEASLHETLWGGRRLEIEGWKRLPGGEIAIGESWETEINTLVQNGPHAGKTLGALVTEWGPELLGAQSIAIFGQRFPLLAKFIDANAQLSVQVHPDDSYAARYEGGKLGKTEFWYILAAEPEARIVYGFNTPTDRIEVERAIQNGTLEHLLHEEAVQAGDVVFVPAGTVHAIGQGILLYELQEYSDVTYRMYDYNRVSPSGKPRELHIERSLDVSLYEVAARAKVRPVQLAGGPGYEERCLVASPYFVTRELRLKQGNFAHGSLSGKTTGSCIILSSLGAEALICYGTKLERSEILSRGRTIVLPAALGDYRIEGQGSLLFSYVPDREDDAWQAWKALNT